MAVESGQIVEMDESEDGEEGDQADNVGHAQLIKMCEQLEHSCISHATHERSLDLSQELRKFRAYLRREELLNTKQTTISLFFSK